MEPTADAAAPTDAPLPASVATIDFEHLARMTLGERRRVAEAAAVVEMRADRPDEGGIAGAVARLADAVDEAKAVIANRLQLHAAR
jgi:hypothetical protein